MELFTSFVPTNLGARRHSQTNGCGQATCLSRAKPGNLLPKFHESQHACTIVICTAFCAPLMLKAGLPPTLHKKRHVLARTNCDIISKWHFFSRYTTSRKKTNVLTFNHYLLAKSVHHPKHRAQKPSATNSNHMNGQSTCAAKVECDFTK